jgi:type VI secretion system protein ImpL
LLTISVLFLIWGLTMVFVSWRAGIRKKAIEETEDGQDRIRRDELIDEAERELKARFKDALKTLKTSSLYRGRSERWRNDLPWYLLIGPQASGKTSLLDFSGLEFPINKIDRKLTRDTLGTRHCDWYFADHGVLIDTAGRYTTQPDAEVDGSAWTTLLELLRKRRRGRPLNGVLVTIPVESLIGGSEQDIDTLARQVRGVCKTSSETARRCAGVPGAEQGRQAARLRRVLRSTDPRRKRSGAGHQFPQGSGRHRRRGPARRVRRAAAAPEQPGDHAHAPERDTQRRGRILDFPHQLGQIGERLCLFVDMAFTGNRYQRVATAWFLPDQCAAPDPGNGRNHRRHRRQPRHECRRAADPAQWPFALHPSSVQPGDFPRGRSGRPGQARAQPHPLGPACVVRWRTGGTGAVRHALGRWFLGQLRASGKPAHAGAELDAATFGADPAR